MEKLKPCPFCGGEAEICSDIDRIMGKYWYIRCKKCYCHGTGIYESGRKLEPQEEYAAITGAWEKAIEAWNRRAELQWIPCSERLPEEYGEYRITWTTSASKKHFVGDSEYEVTGEWDDKRNDFKGEWLLDDYIKAYPNVKVIAWKPIEEPYAERRTDE